MPSLVTFGLLAFASTAFAYPSYTLAEGSFELAPRGIFGRQQPPLDTNAPFLPSGTFYYSPTGTGGPTGGTGGPTAFPTGFPTGYPTGSPSGSPHTSLPSPTAPYQNTTYSPTSTFYPPTTVPNTLPTTLPTTFPITSSSTVLLTTSTIYATIVSTITSCPPVVTKCPLGSVVTVTIPISTTICPVGESKPTVTLVPTPQYTPSIPASPSTKSPTIPGASHTAAPYPSPSPYTTVTKAAGAFTYASGTGAAPSFTVIVEIAPLKPGATNTPPKVINTGAAGKVGLSSVLGLVVAGAFALVF